MSAQRIDPGSIGRSWWAKNGLGLTLLDVEPGYTYRVGEILFGLVRDALWESGIREGTLLQVTARHPDSVEVIVDGSAAATLELSHGAFIPVGATQTRVAETNTGHQGTSHS